MVITLFAMKAYAVIVLCICQSVWFFNNSSQPSFYEFTVLEHCFIVSWNACISLPVIVICPGIVLLLVLHLLFLTTIRLFIILSTNIVDAGCLYSGVCCWIFVNVTKYICQQICSCVRLLCGIDTVSPCLPLLI